MPGVGGGVHTKEVIGDRSVDGLIGASCKYCIMSVYPVCIHDVSDIS